MFLFPRKVHPKKVTNGSFSYNISDKTNSPEAGVRSTSHPWSDHRKEDVPQVASIHIPCLESHIQAVLLVPPKLPHDEVPPSSSPHHSSS